MPAGSKKAEQSDQIPEVLRKIRDQITTVGEDAVRRAFSNRRDLFVRAIVAQLRAAKIGATVEASATEEWIGIESLSRLRSVVGGRFENLKRKWVDAGLPLREHRGDRVERFELQETGWIELSNWIAKQGFEVRLVADKPGCLFELRPTAARSGGT